MTDKVKNQAPGNGKKDSFESDSFDKKAISEISKKADQGEALLFVDKLLHKEHGSKEGEKQHAFGESQSGGRPSRFGGLSRDGEHSVFIGSTKGDRPHAFGESQSGGRPSRFGGLSRDGEHSGFIGSTKGDGSHAFGELQKNAKTVFDASNTCDVGKKDKNGFVANMPKVANQEDKKDINYAKENLSSSDKNAVIDTDAQYVGQSAEIKDTSALSGGVILDSIQMQRVSPASPEAAQVIKSIGVQVAEKIIATYEALNAKQEVRITLQDGVLKDTDVLISKDGKALNVNFVTGSKESADILNHRSGELRTQLMEKFDDLTQIDVEVEHQTENDNQNSDGRSQNRFGKQPDQEDDEQN